jgi:hypothetical protein
MRQMLNTRISRRSLINTGRIKQMNKLTISILLFVMFNWMNSGAQERNISDRIVNTFRLLT